MVTRVSRRRRRSSKRRKQSGGKRKVSRRRRRSSRRRKKVSRRRTPRRKTLKGGADAAVGLDALKKNIEDKELRLKNSIKYLTVEIGDAEENMARESVKLAKIALEAAKEAYRQAAKARV